MKRNLSIGLVFILVSCSAQKKVDATLIFDSKIKNEPVLAIEKIDSLYFSNKYDWMIYKNVSLWYNDVKGIKYSYSYDDKVLSEVNGLFSDDRRMRNPSDFFGEVEFNFYFDKSIVGWLTLSKNRDFEVLRTVDIERNIKNEVTFTIPKALQDIDPIVIDVDCLLFNNYILRVVNGKTTLDTLDVGADVSFPHSDRVFMRRNSFMVNKYFELENPRQSQTNPIDFIRIEGKKMIAQKINPPNVKIANYRVENSHENIWLMSHKVSPHKLMLYDIAKDKAFPFELDGSIFKLENLNLIELPPDRDDPYDVKFSYHTAMTENAIYLYLLKNGIKIYKITDYRTLLR